MQFRSPGRAALLLLPLIAACSDRQSNPAAAPIPDAPAGTAQALTCTATVATGAVVCASPTVGGGARFDRITAGGQYEIVRLASSNVAYSGGVFAFDVAVQNSSNLAMATDDGTTANGEGVRVVLPAAPMATSGSGAITVDNETGSTIFSGSEPQDFFQYGGTAGSELGADGILSSAEVSTTKRWQFGVPATVNTFTFTLWVSTRMPGTPQTVAPQITSISPTTMVPGSTVTITGINFDPTPANDTVYIGGTKVVASAATSTSLTVTVPCLLTGTLPVYATRGNLRGVARMLPLQGNQRTVGIGQALIVTNPAEVACNELTSANGTARYIVSVFSASTSPSSNSPFQLVRDNAPAGEAVEAPAAANVVLPGLQAQVANATQNRADARHFELLEKNRAAYAQLRARNAGNQNGARRNVVAADPVEPPLTRTFRISNINEADICNKFYVVSATRVYYNGKIAIYEDDATPAEFKQSTNATMAASYQKIGDQFNTDMEPIIRTNFGDVLRRDAETDNNGVLVALFTPRINTSFTNVAGFVVTCDQFPNTDTGTYPVGGPYTGTTNGNGASNFGQFFYAYQPVVAGAGYSSNTAQNWYRTIRSTFIHETKHVVSQAARVENNASAYEASWLEEGTARHAEELWMRNAVDNVAWKANTGHGSAANPINTYCDFRPGFAECDANPRRPANIMQRHFSSMYTHMFGSNARLLSPFGATASDNASYFYAISWSLVRYSIDRYAASDAAFFTALTESTDVGPTNLANRTGQPIDRLLGGWALSLAADDHPSLAGPANPDIQMPTWNFRNIYAGFNTDLPSTYTLPYPLVPTQLTFGAFTAPAAITTLRGGGALWYEFSGTQTAPQLIKLQGSGGTAIPSTLRMAVTRIQ